MWCWRELCRKLAEELCTPRRSSDEGDTPLFAEKPETFQNKAGGGLLQATRLHGSTVSVRRASVGRLRFPKQFHVVRASIAEPQRREPHYVKLWDYMPNLALTKDREEQAEPRPRAGLIVRGAVRYCEPCPCFKSTVAIAKHFLQELGHSWPHVKAAKHGTEDKDYVPGNDEAKRTYDTTAPTRQPPPSEISVLQYSPLR